MSKDKKSKVKKKNQEKKESIKAPEKKGGGFVNFLLFVVLLAGIGWLIYSNRNNTSHTAGAMKEAQVKEFIKNNGETLFSGAKFSVKSLEKENGLWRAILDVDGQVQDFYTTIDGQIIQGTKTVKEVMKSDKEETLGDLDAKGNVKIDDALKGKIKEFIEKNLVSGDMKIEVKEITKEHGLIKVNTVLQGNEQPLYLTLDGKKVVFTVMSIDDIKESLKKQEEAQNIAATVTEENKNDKPVVEYFVMSYCPYGTQFEKGIIPALKALGDKIQPTLKFVSYAMHEKKEIDENLVQYCIQKNNPEKLYDYLECFLASQDGDSCLSSTGIDDAKLSGCITTNDKKFAITELYEDKDNWKGQFPSFNVDKEDNVKYGVQGSPTLIINGQKIEPRGRDSKNLLEAICSGFKNAPAECDKELSSDAPAPGFGSGKATGGSGGGCGQ